MGRALPLSVDFGTMAETDGNDHQFFVTDLDDDPPVANPLPPVSSQVANQSFAVSDTYADHFRSTEPELPIELAMIEHFISLLPEPREVLDAGCGAGRMMPLLDALGGRVEGMDLSPGMVRRAQADHGKFRSRVGSLTALPFPDGSFDGVFSWYSTIHNPDDDLAQILRETHRVLRSGGVLLLAFQCGEGVSDVSQSYRRRGHDITLHRYNRTAEQISDSTTHEGFREAARLVRRAAAHEKEDQGVFIATA